MERWVARRRRHELAWSLALAMFAIASAALWLGAAKGWDGATFRVFFLFGAILNVRWAAARRRDGGDPRRRVGVQRRRARRRTTATDGRRHRPPQGVGRLRSPPP